MQQPQAAPQQPQAAPPPPSAPPPSAAAPVEEGYTDELEKLSDLKVKGVITNEQFEAKKKHILGI